MNYSYEEIFGKAIGQIIHDIRNSLNIIIGFSSLVLTDSNLDNESKKYYNKILLAGSSIEKLLLSVDDCITEDYEIINNNFDILAETKNFFKEQTDILKDFKIKIEYLSDTSIVINSSLDLYKKLLNNLFQFSLKDFRNIEQKNIQIGFKLVDNELNLIYSDSTLPIKIVKNYFNFEEVLASKRGLCLVFIEKYVKLLNSNLKYFYGNNWNDIILKYSKDFNNNHGFIIKIPISVK